MRNSAGKKKTCETSQVNLIRSCQSANKSPHHETDDCAHHNECEQTERDFFENAFSVGCFVLSVESIACACDDAHVVVGAFCIMMTTIIATAAITINITNAIKTFIAVSYLMPCSAARRIEFNESSILYLLKVTMRF